ncbi:MAG: hypothetical protein RLZZ28_677 [Bacteroidota bacterium]|jgi:hypothetical protein
MQPDRFNHFLLISILLASLVLFVDGYFLPLKEFSGVLVSKTERSDAKLRIVIFAVEREKKLLSVPAQAYQTINVNDTIVIGRSRLTNTILKLSLYRAGEKYSWRTGFLFLGGMDFLLLFVIGIPVFLWVYQRNILQPKTRRDMSIYIALLFSVLLLFYFLFN